MSAWEELVTAATVGVGRRPVAHDVLARATVGADPARLDRDPAGAVLDAAALLDAARRAGGLVPRPVQLPDPAPVDDGPELPADARAVLRDLLRRNDTVLTREALTAMAVAGVRIAAPDLPDVLALAERDASLRGPVTSVIGERGRWLAAQRPLWLRMVDPRATDLDDDAWQTGRPAERRAWLTELRLTDPDAARETLAQGWGRENGDDRVALIDVLRLGLSASDEPFLDAALDDRKAEVRERARRLLAQLPTSAFVARAAARATGVLQLERHALRRRLVVTLPGPPGHAAQRDGLTLKPPVRSLGEHAWHLLQVIATAPLTVWGDLADPDTLAGLEIDGDFAAEVRTGWRLAAVAGSDPSWASALLDHPRPPGPLVPADEQLVSLLSDAEKVRRAIAALTVTRGRPAPAADLAACPTPWPEPLTDAVLAAFERHLRANDPGTPGPALREFGRCIALDRARQRLDELHGLAERMRSRAVEVPAAARWVVPLDRAADVLDARRRFHHALTPIAAPSPTQEQLQ